MYKLLHITMIVIHVKHISDYDIASITLTFAIRLSLLFENPRTFCFLDIDPIEACGLVHACIFVAEAWV
jgi:hypothetical protein